MRLACLRSESLLLFISSVLISLLFWIPTDTWWDPHSLRPADCPQQSRTSILIPVLSNKGFSACSLSLLAHAWAFFFPFGETAVSGRNSLIIIFLLILVKTQLFKRLEGHSAQLRLRICCSCCCWRQKS